MFQNSVLTVFHSESAPNSDTTRWGENEQVDETATDSDHKEHTTEEKKTEHNDETQEKDEYGKEENIWDRANEETKTLEQIVKTINQLPDNHYVWGYPDPTRVHYTYEQGNKWEATNDERDFIHWYDSQLHTMAELKELQRVLEPYNELTMKVKETEGSSYVEPEWGRTDLGEGNEEWKEDPWYHPRDSKDSGQHVESKQAINRNTENKTESLPVSAEEHDAYQSSSIEPEWGRRNRRNKKELEEDYLTWKTANVGGYTSHRTTQAYRHGQCYMCSKSVSITHLDPEVELFCRDCEKDLTRLDCEFENKNNPKKGMERRDRDDEEEWGRFPIPQSDDSENEPWFDWSPSPESEQDDEDVPCDTTAKSNEKGFSQNVLIIVSNTLLVNKQSTEDFAFRNVPRRDGIIRRKDGTLITIDDRLYPEQNQSRKPLKREKGLPETGIAPPR
jgi:hypothetical protein